MPVVHNYHIQFKLWVYTTCRANARVCTLDSSSHVRWLVKLPQLLAGLVGQETHLPMEKSHVPLTSCYCTAHVPNVDVGHHSCMVQ